MKVPLMLPGKNLGVMIMRMKRKKTKKILRMMKEKNICLQSNMMKNVI